MNPKIELDSMNDGDIVDSIEILASTTGIISFHTVTKAFHVV